MRWLVHAVGVFAIGCGPSVVGDDGDGGGDGDGADDGDDDGIGDADPDASGLTHTYVTVEFHRGQSEDRAPYGGTGRVTVNLGYNDCILDFYARHPELRADAPEGHAIFGPLAAGGEGWSDRLCAREDGFATCGIVSISQSLLDVPVFGFTVVYAVEGDLEGRRLRVGPLPTTETAMCGAGALPSVRAGADFVIGVDGTGTMLWTTESFDPTELVAGQDTGFRVYGSAW